MNLQALEIVFSFTIGFTIGGISAFLAYQAGWKARDMQLTRGGSFGRQPFIFNEGRTVKGKPLLCPPAHVLAECGCPVIWRDGFHYCDCGLIQKLNPRLKSKP